MRLLLTLLLLSAAVACDAPEPDPTPADDDDDVALDDDDVVDDDDSAEEEATPEEVVIPDGADVGVPGAFVGLRARTLGDDPIVSPAVEVRLKDPAARDTAAPLDPKTQAEMDRYEANLTPEEKAAMRNFRDRLTERFEEVER